MVGHRNFFPDAELGAKSGSNISVDKQVRKNTEHKSFQQMTQQKSHFYAIPSSTFKNFVHENLCQRQTFLRKTDILTNGKFSMI